MIEFSVNFLYGMAFGLLIMDSEDTEHFECDWGFIIMLGPVGFQFIKVKQA